MKLRAKIIVLISFLIIFLIGGLLWYLDGYLKNYLKIQANNNLRAMAEISERTYFAYMENEKIRAINWSSDGYIRNATESILEAMRQENSGEKERLAKELSAYMRERKIVYDPEVIIMDILGPDGIVIASSKEDRIGTDEAEEEKRLSAHKFSQAIKAEFGQAFINPAVIEEDESLEPMSRVVTRVFSTKMDEGGKLIPLDAVALVHFADADKINDMLSGQRMMEQGAATGQGFLEKYETAEIYLVNKQGLIIASSRSSIDSTLKQKADTLPVKKCFEQKEEVVGEYLNYRGRQVLGASMCLMRDNLALLLEISPDEVLSPLEEIRSRIIAGGILIFLLSILGVAILSSWLFKGLKEITAAANKAAKGDMDIRAEVKGKDEIGQLAGAFNQMIDNIRKEDKFILLLRDVAIGVNEVNDINKAYQIIIDKICFYKNWPIGHVYISENKGSGALAPTKIWHLSDPEKFKIFKEVTEKTSFKKGAGLPGRILESKNPIWISDVAKDSNFPRTKLMENINVGAAFGFPALSEDGKVSAVFEFFSAEPEEMDGGFLKIIGNINLQINRAMERITFKEQLEKKVKERTAELMELKAGLEKIVSRRTVDLEKKLDELEKFKKLTIDRELKMVELKREIGALKNKESQL